MTNRKTNPKVTLIVNWAPFQLRLRLQQQLPAHGNRRRHHDRVAGQESSQDLASCLLDNLLVVVVVAAMMMMMVVVKWINVAW